MFTDVSVNVYKTTRRQIPEDGTFHIHRRKNLKSHISSCILFGYVFVPPKYSKFATFSILPVLQQDHILNYYLLSADHHIRSHIESRYAILPSSGRRTLISLHLSVGNQIGNIILATLPYDVAESLPIAHFVMNPLRETVG
jgi:hypothetical protein